MRVKTSGLVDLTDCLLLNRNNFVGEGKSRVPVKEYTESKACGNYAVVEALMISESCDDVILVLHPDIHYTASKAKVRIFSDRKSLEELMRVTLECFNVFYVTKEHWDALVEKRKNPNFIPWNGRDTRT